MMSLLYRMRQIIAQEGLLALLHKLVRGIVLRLRLYAWLPLAYKLGIPTPLDLPDREFLEKKIFGWLQAEPSVKRILFAGVESYTWHYYRFFRNDQAFFTIDYLAKQAFWGRKGFHTVGSVTELDAYYKPASFDVVIFNGLIGWGLDDRDAINQSFHQAYKALVSGGLLIVGWPNESKYIDFPLEDLDGYLLFETYIPHKLGLDSCRVEVSPWRRHTFDFLIKK